MNDKAKKIFDGIKSKYNLTTDQDLAILEMFAGSIVNMREAQANLDETGVIVLDRYKVPKANPANDVLRINKAQAMAALKQLGLEEVTTKDPLLNLLNGK